MMQPDAENFKVFFEPAFDKNISDAKINMFIEKAKAEISQKWWSKRYVYGVFYLAAHFLVAQLEVTNDGDIAGIKTVTSEKAGEIQINYGSPATEALSPEDAQLMTTWYGQEYYRMRESIGIGFMVVHP